MVTSEIQKISALPLVTLDEIKLPRKGLYFELPDTCKVHFSDSNSACRIHYETIRNKFAEGTFSSCPYGFSTYSFSIDEKKMALTAFVPWPRTGGQLERQISKRSPKARCSRTGVAEVASQLISVNSALKTLELRGLKNTSMALHEIRKLNAKIKQTSEELNEDQSLPSQFRDRTTKIFKAAELMSSQFSIVEVLANERLVSLPLKDKQNVFKLIDKYRKILGEDRIRLDAPPRGTYKDILIGCESTFPIIFSVLLTNAIKYAIPGTQITVEITVDVDIDSCRVSVTNNIPPGSDIDQRVFGKGFRMSDDGEGTGNGLYVAQLVACQHETNITVRTEYVGPLKFCVFEVVFKMDSKSRWSSY